MATTKDSVLYAAIQTNKYLSDQRLSGGNVVRVPFEVTAVAPHATSDVYNLCVIPANCRVVALDAIVTVACTASTTITIGTVATVALYLASAAAVSVGTRFALVYTAYGYTPTADSLVQIVMNGATPTEGQQLKGFFDVIPAY